MGGRMKRSTWRDRRAPSALILFAITAVLAGCTAGGSPGETPGPTGSPSFTPAARTRTVAARLFDEAWSRDDRKAANEVASGPVVAAMFRVDPRGWSEPRCNQGVCRLKKPGVPGQIEWSIVGGPAGYYVSRAEVPPIPLEVARLTGKPWGLYLAAGSSGSSQLVATAAELEGVGLNGRTIATLLVSCQPPAAEKLQVPASYYTVSVFFDRKAEAETFADGLAFPPIGLFKVQVTC
jgi:hypothetical protein